MRWNGRFAIFCINVTKWASTLISADAVDCRSSPGATAYAKRKTSMYLNLARTADQAFLATNPLYKSVF